MAEQFAFKQRFRECCAIDLDQWVTLSRAVLVNGIGEKFFTGPALTQNQHSSIRWRYQGYSIKQGFHHTAAPDNIRKVEALVDLLL